MSKNLIVRCFLENAREEGKKVVMEYGNTYEDVDLNKYDVTKNTLVINNRKIGVRDVYESVDGYLLKINGHVLQAI